MTGHEREPVQCAAPDLAGQDRGQGPAQDHDEQREQQLLTVTAGVRGELGERYSKVQVKRYGPKFEYGLVPLT